MATVLKIGPVEHGRPMTLAEFHASDSEEGYQYELIDGKLYVSPEANAPEGLVEKWIFTKLDRYSVQYTEVINFVYNKARVFVPGRPGVTIPEPDVAAYHGFPLHLDYRKIRWQDLSPVLVVEVLSIDDPYKDLVRNAELYLQVSTIKEYWLLDTRPDPNRPTMRVHRRHGKKWRMIDLVYRDPYTTKFLPGFELILDPRT
jgi:Uma2 family endonuclease